MKYIGIFLVMICCTVFLGVVAQSDEATKDPKETNTIEPNTEVSASTEVSAKESQDDSVQVEVTPTPRQYPIAAGVWYPGDPVPTVPSRYYRIRCWPGCHSYGEWTGPVNPDKKPSASY